MITLFMLLHCLILRSQALATLDALCTTYPNDTSIKTICADLSTQTAGQGLKFTNTISRFDSLAHYYLNNATYRKAEHIYSATTAIWRKLENNHKLCSSLIYLGRTHYRQGNIFESFQHINEGILLAQEVEDTELEGKGHLYLSWTYWRIRQCDEALNQLMNMKKLLTQSLMDTMEWGGYYNARAKFEHCNGNEKISFMMADSAIMFARKNKLRRLESVAMSNKVNYLQKNGTFEEKYDLVTKALEINTIQNDVEQLGSNYALLASTYLTSKKYNQSLEASLQSLKISTAINDKPRIYEAHTLCRKSYVGLKDYSNAYIHEREARILADDIYGLPNIARIFELQKAKSKAVQDQKLQQIASEKELERLKLVQERRTYAIVSGSLFLLLLGGLYSWSSYKKNKERETQLVKEVLENEMRELEMQSLRALMNPHFIFNSLNSIKGFIIRNEPEVASDYLNKFSHLIRLILSNSQKSTIPLSDELKALEMYIQLEGLRLEDKFEYSINVHDSVDLNNVRVAPMIIQPFVENSIWHGLMNKKGSKVLHIDIKKEADMISIVITDNGVGRQAAKMRKQNIGIKKKSYGMKITENRIKVAQQENAVIVNDLLDDDKNPCGTEVIIQLNHKNHE
ncbi:MAG: histidine kinase [Saprospiraceae bacterium]|nr:histidine kinase [Saprospiraceae bacterium]